MSHLHDTVCSNSAKLWWCITSGSTRLHSSVNHPRSKSTAYEISSETLPLFWSHSSVITAPNLYILITPACISMPCCFDICSVKEVRIIEYKYPVKGRDTSLSAHSDTANHNSLSKLCNESVLVWSFEPVPFEGSFVKLCAAGWRGGARLYKKEETHSFSVSLCQHHSGC